MLYAELLQRVANERNAAARVALLEDALSRIFITCEHFGMVLSLLRMPAEKLSVAEAVRGRLVDKEKCRATLAPVLTSETVRDNSVLLLSSAHPPPCPLPPSTRHLPPLPPTPPLGLLHPSALRLRVPA